MFEILVHTFLLSISPFGEARLGIPYAVFNDIHVVPSFFTGLIANLLVFPILMWLMVMFNKRLLAWKQYKKAAVRLARKAKNGVGGDIAKYGFWGLMVFVMIPLPFTGAYMGTIAAYVLNIERKKAFLAVSLGVTISCIIIAAGSHLSLLGIQLF